MRTVTIPVPAAGPGSIAWDGRGDAGAYVPDGDYTLSLTPLDRARNAGPPVEVGVAVFGAFVGLTPAPVRFFPQDGDAIMPRTVARFTLKTAAAVRLTILDGRGTRSGRSPARTRPARSASPGTAGRTAASSRHRACTGSSPSRRSAAGRDPRNGSPRRRLRDPALGDERPARRADQRHDHHERAARARHG